VYAASERLMVDQLITHIGEMELQRRESPTQTNPVLAASIEVGKACVTLARRRVSRRDYPLLMGPPRQRLEAIRKDSRASFVERRQARMLELGAMMIENRNYPTEIANTQKRIKYETAAQLGATIKAIGKLRGKEGENRRGTLNGDIAELTTIGLLNYGDNVNHFGAFSPPHHDRMKNPERNHDAIFGQNVNGEELTQALQVKLACGGFCEDGKTPEPDPRYRYTSDIALISGHCDLGLRTDFYTKRLKLGVPELLVKSEFEPENLWSRDRRALSTLSEELVHTIVEDGASTRAGMARVRDR
jgi:hypothetical protein